MMYRLFFNVNTVNEIKIFDKGGFKVMWAVPEIHMIIFLVFTEWLRNFREQLKK